MGKIKKNFLIENLEVIDISTEGKAIARHEGLVVFIDGAVPGDVVDVMVHRKKNSFAEGKVHAVKLFSPHRVAPACEHFGTCGGCKWQNLSYDMQLTFKQKYVYDAFTRIGKFDFPPLLPILPNEKPYYYRNKLEFSASNKKWLSTEEMQSAGEIANKNALGFHIPGLFDKILNIHTCHLQEDPSNAIRRALNTYATEQGLSFFDIRNRTGFLRTLLIRTSSTGQIMVLIAVCDWLEKELMDLLVFMKVKFPQVTSWQYTHNDKGNDTLYGLDIKTYHGPSYIVESMEGLQFKISAKSFYQTNSTQGYALYQIAREFAGLEGHEVVYDLYTGTGTIANFIARKAKKVVGIDYVADAIRDAKDNAMTNGLQNTDFFSGDMKLVLNEEFVTTNGKPEVIITDPPRAGMEFPVIEVILKVLPKKIVYVSCNPSTQARDIALMSDKYRVVKSRAVDMFPQTAHVENVTLLVLKDELAKG
jgi:23S rRNA (uracil1939-C5)-methyltransferase